jgi:hypothetical protein
MTSMEHPGGTVPAKVETRLGTLEYEWGYPTAETTRKLFDEIDFQRAVQAYMWAYPVVSFESIQTAAKRDIGTDLNELAIADNFLDPRSVWFTANDTTVYAVAAIDLAQAGPVVIDIPPGALVGLIDDYWQRNLTDVGLPGPDGDKGGKYLMLPPDYAGEVPGDGYHVLHGTMNNYSFMIRGIVMKRDVPDAVQRVKQVRIYPWSERAQPKPTKFVSMSGVEIDTTPPGGLEFWEILSGFINHNPVQERDRFFMAMLKPLGIEKDQPFAPDARQRALLEEAATLGDAMGRSILFDAPKRISGATMFPGTQWEWSTLLDSSGEAESFSQLDERLGYTYGAIYTSPFIGTRHAGPGSTYVQAFKDKDRNRLDGSRSYRLHVPANTPATAFWSLTLYDTGTRSMVQSPSNDAAHSSYDDDLKKDADGSIDLYFGPQAPSGGESNWLETVPGSGFYPMFRFYTPTAPLFDGTWSLPDIELT